MARIATAIELMDLEVDPQTQSLYVTDSTDRLHVMDSSSYEELQVIPGRGPMALDRERMLKICRLIVDSNQVSDLAPLTELTALKILSLTDNQITDLAPLAGLTALELLSVNDNAVTSLAALVANEGLTYGAWISLTGNPLDCATESDHITELESRGITLLTDCT